MSDLKAVKKYIRPGWLGIYIACILVIALIVSTLSTMKFDFRAALFCIVIAVWWNVRTFFDYSIFSNTMQSFADEASAADLSKDFDHSEKVLQGQLRLGDKYLYGHHSCRILRYSDISRVYKHIRKGTTYFHLDLISGDSLDLVTIHTISTSNEDVVDAVKKMLIRNPNIVVGYR